MALKNETNKDELLLYTILFLFLYNAGLFYSGYWQDEKERRRKKSIRRKYEVGNVYANMQYAYTILLYILLLWCILKES